MTEKTKANKVVDQMYNNDPFSKWLGIKRLEEKPGYCKLQMKVRNEMLNGFNIAHGGICYSLADSALAFAANTHGRMSVSVETSISHTEAVKENDILTAVAEETHVSNKTGLYHITISTQDNKKVAFFKGTVYRTSKNWEV